MPWVIRFKYTVLDLNLISPVEHKPSRRPWQWDGHDIPMKDKKWAEVTFKHKVNLKVPPDNLAPVQNLVQTHSPGTRQDPPMLIKAIRTW